MQLPNEILLVSKLSGAIADAFTNFSSESRGGATIVIVYFNSMKHKGNFVAVLNESCGGSD